MRLIIALLSTPYIFASKLLCKFGPVALRDDVEKCSEMVGEFSDRAKYLRFALVIAEDHRNELHFGIDPLSILSALIGRIFKGKRRGASTIEQQFVRVITGRYEPTVRRKIREQLIAIEICRRHEKSHIADSYLSRAFFGSGQDGVEQLEKNSDINLEKIDLIQSIALTAQLKYPKPIKVTEQWRATIKARRNHLRIARGSDLKQGETSEYSKAAFSSAKV